jgi:Family of unknown function (DUF5754)
MKRENGKFKLTEYMENLKLYSNPLTVLKKAKEYVKKHPVDEIKQLNTSKCGELIGKINDNAFLFVSTNKNKKYMLFNGKNKIHFGQLGYDDYTKHKDILRRELYLKRSSNIKGNWKSDSYSPNNLSIHLLW